MGHFRLLILDVDGTLVDVDEQISTPNRVALERAREAGCSIVIATARNKYSLDPIVSGTCAIDYAILSNGATVMEWRTGKQILRIRLPEAAVREAAALAQATGLAPICYGTLDDGGFAVYADGSGFIPEPYRRLNRDRIHYHENVVRSLPGLPASMSVYGPEHNAKELARLWRGRLGPAVAVYDGASPRNGCWVTYCTPAETSKALAAQRVATLLGIPREQTLAIGDEMNDLDLLQWAGLGVCMGDGHKDVRACADHVTGSLADHGVAQAIERFVLS